VGACAAALITILVVILLFVLGASWTTDPLALASLVVATVTGLVAFWALAAALLAARYGYLAARYAYDQLVLVQREQERVVAELARRPELVVGFAEPYILSIVPDDSGGESAAQKTAGLRRGGMALKPVQWDLDRGGPYSRGLTPTHVLGLTLKNIGQKTARDIVIDARIHWTVVKDLEFRASLKDVRIREERDPDSRRWIMQLSALNPNATTVLIALFTQDPAHPARRDFFARLSLSMADAADVDVDLFVRLESDDEYEATEPDQGRTDHDPACRLKPTSKVRTMSARASRLALGSSRSGGGTRSEVAPRWRMVTCRVAEHRRLLRHEAALESRRRWQARRRKLFDLLAVQHATALGRRTATVLFEAVEPRRGERSGHTRLCDALRLV
jgi:hypothetical protein